MFEQVLLGLVGLGPFRCEQCDSRFYGPFGGTRPGMEPAESSATQSPGLVAVAFLVAPLFLFLVPVFGWIPAARTSTRARPPAAEVRPPLPTALDAWRATAAPGAGWALPVASSPRAPKAEDRSYSAALQEPAKQPLGALRVSGEVYVDGQRVTAEQTIFVGETLRTGADGSATVTLAGRGLLVLGAQTEVSFARGPRYFATLEEGTVAFRTLLDARNVQIQVGNYVVVPVAAAAAAVEIQRSPDGEAQIHCTAGSVGIIPLEGAEGVFLRPGQEATISAAGQLRAGPPPAAAPAPAPEPSAPAPQVKKKSKTGLVVLVIAGGGAAGAAFALRGKGSSRPAMSPSVP